MAAWIDLREPGMVVLKTVTLHPRRGNPPPRIVEVPGGILNSIGLPNEGIDHLIGVTLPRMRGRCAALMVNVAGERVAEFGTIGEKLAAAARAQPDDFAAVEINLSCPERRVGLPLREEPRARARVRAAGPPARDRAALRQALAQRRRHRRDRAGVPRRAAPTASRW